MDRVRIPFNPGAGSRPPLLVGRDAQIDALTLAIERLSIGRGERSVLLKGLRGVGKTVLLNEFGIIAAKRGWFHEHNEASEDVHLATAVAAMSRRALLELSAKERVKDRALGVLRGFVKVHVPTGDGSFLTIRSEEHTSELQSLRHLVCRLLLE